MTPSARAILVVAALFLCAGGAAADPIEDFFHYEAPVYPEGGDCDAIAAEIGSAATWHGEFSGNHYDSFTDKYTAFGAFGCFRTEFECRVWQHQALTYIGRGLLYYMRCTRGG